MAGVALVGKDAAMGVGRELGVRLVLPGSGTGGPAVWSRVLGVIRNDGKDGRVLMWGYYVRSR